MIVLRIVRFGALAAGIDSSSPAAALAVLLEIVTPLRLRKPFDAMPPPCEVEPAAVLPLIVELMIAVVPVVVMPPPAVVSRPSTLFPETVGRIHQ